MPEIHTIDPEGDVVLVVTSTYFKSPPPRFPTAPVTLADGSIFYPVCMVDNDKQADGGEGTKDESPLQPDNGEEIEYETFEEETRIRVSAKHLMLASPWFKSCLTGGYKETKTFEQNGTVELDELSAELVAQVALVADYYGCNALVDYYMGLWLKPPPNMDGEAPLRKLMLRLYSSWISQRPVEFRTTSSLMMQQAHNAITPLGVPLPPDIIAALNAGREKALGNVVVKARRMHQELVSRSPEPLSDQWLWRYGKLHLFLEKSGLFFAKTPYENMGIKKIVADFNSNFNFGTRWSSDQHERRLSHYYMMPESRYNVLTGLSDSVPGLDLNDFPFE
ncbi:hypothetical protein BJY00DRAFT_311997 [Aspergillus carlsbadensis]|nr:hypothetical protein BJY00DRAFT_311997 [Aspergillus carlsbadensis]